MAACAFPAGVADLASTFEALGTIPGTTCFSGGSVGNRAISGVLYNEMFTGQIGTTSTYTASDWWVDFIGADLGIIVSEAGMVYVPDVEDTWLDKYDPDGLGPASPTRILNQYQNIGCQGSDLPLGGLLGLDRKLSKNCRPNDFSAGLVFLAASNTTTRSTPASRSSRRSSIATTSKAQRLRRTATTLKTVSRSALASPER